MNNDFINAEFVADAIGGMVVCDSGLTANGIFTDSRETIKGGIFAAIKGERTDGNNYIIKAAENGAGGVICQNPPEIEVISRYPCFVVSTDDTVVAMGKLATAYREKLSCTAVGVTGSVGKTTTRSMIQSVLETTYKTCGTIGNHNNEIGLPLTVLNTDLSSEFAVYELAMSAKGEIDYLSSICRPNIAVITNIGTAHIEYLGSREAIRDAKMEIAPYVENGGTLILNGDEPLLEGVDGAFYCSVNNKNSDLFAQNIRFSDGGMLFDAVEKNGGQTDDLFIPLYGEHAVLDALYAFAIGKMCSVPDDSIRLGLKNVKGVGNRQRVVEKNGLTIVCDYYNASPESFRASVLVAEKLALQNGGKTIIVLGSVLELGEHSETLHREMGEFASKHGDCLFTFGSDAGYAACEAEKNGIAMVRKFDDINDVEPIIDAIREAIAPNDVVLFKASHGMNLGRIASAFTQERE